MSSDSHQRKQELLIRLSETRINVIDEAEALAFSVKKSFSWIRPVTHALTGRGAGAAASLGVAVAGFLVARGVVKLIFPSSHRQQGGEAASHSSMGSVIKTSLWSILAASVLPAVKQMLQQVANRKISDFVAKFLSR